VPPALGVLVLAILIRLRSTTGVTLSTAVAVLALDPRLVVSEPAAMLLTSAPVAPDAVTTAVTVQTPPAGMIAPAERLSDPAPGAAAATPPGHEVCAEGVAAFTIPDGKLSTSGAASVADVNACVLVRVMVSSDVPPTATLVGENDFVTNGREAATASVSTLAQSPAVHDPDVLVLVMPVGGATVAVLATWVCANACPRPNAIHATRNSKRRTRPRNAVPLPP